MNDIILGTIAKIFVDKKFNLINVMLEKIDNDFVSDDDENLEIKQEGYTKKGKIDSQFDENEFITKKNLFYYAIYIFPQNE